MNIKGYIGGTTLGGPSVQQEGGTTTIYAGQTLTVAGGYRQDGGTLQTRDNGLQTVAKIAGDVQINVGSVKVACVAGTYGSLSVLAGSGSGDLTMAKGTILYLAVNVPTGGVIPGSDYSSINAAGSVNVDSSLGTVLSVTTTGGANVVAGTSKWVAVHSGAAFNDQFNPNWNGGYAWTLTINRTDDDVSATKPPSRAEPLAPPSQALDLGQGNIPSMPSSNLGATEASEADAIFAVIVPGTRLFFGPALTEWTRGNVGPAAPNPDQPTPLQDAMILRFER